ncbi:heavy-metal-associated domain-containing protein [Allosalinactinospora lopnorensis]|uniref:heavy-metal-associated domain-containing protein n=1 Tax=Allosalinactinospora lopnorensis TaxID=1352348 RepID=UPI000623C105|nr:heavy-metal-associated domain-containing protein [Allosalinactinospora lopnorensis]
MTGANGRGGTAVTTLYTVQGMTCGHCAASVTEEVSGVTGVHVDLATGRLTVSIERRRSRNQPHDQRRR